MYTKKIIRLLSMFTMLLVMAGCSFRELDRTLDAVENKVEQKLDTAEDKLENTAHPFHSHINETYQAPSAQLTAKEAQLIALKHAELTAEQIRGLRVEFEIDDRLPHYDIEFRHDKWEYEYKIHGESGDILSFDRDM